MNSKTPTVCGPLSKSLILNFSLRDACLNPSSSLMLICGGQRALENFDFYSLLFHVLMAFQVSGADPLAEYSTEEEETEKKQRVSQKKSTFLSVLSLHFTGKMVESVMLRLNSLKLFLWAVSSGSHLFYWGRKKNRFDLRLYNVELTTRSLHLLL